MGSRQAVQASACGRSARMNRGKGQDWPDRCCAALPPQMQTKVAAGRPGTGIRANVLRKSDRRVLDLPLSSGLMQHRRPRDWATPRAARRDVSASSGDVQQKVDGGKFVEHATPKDGDMAKR